MSEVEALTLWDFVNWIRTEGKNKPSQEQIELLARLVTSTLDWHNQYEEAHLDIREQIKQLEGAFKTHRHRLVLLDKP